MNASKDNARLWERNARANAFWAILTDRDRTARNWNAGEFFATGRAEWGAVLAHMRALGIAPAADGVFLDFGCGVGRVTQPLLGHFASGYGVDVSQTMIDLANAHSQASAKRPTYVANARDDLSFLPGNSIDFVYCHLVLQHLPRALQRAFIAEFLRVLKPGGIAAFQIPTGEIITSFAGRAKKALRAVLPRPAIRAVRKLSPANASLPGISLEMNVLSETSIGAIVLANNCVLLAAPYTNSTATSHRGEIEFFSREAAIRAITSAKTDSRYLSQFFFVRKDW